jgi:hypothetical protein
MDKWYTEGIPQEKNPDQMQLQFRSSLLKKKKALIEMAPSPSMLPPRDDISGHMDKQEQDLLTKDTMQGVKVPLNPKKKKHLPQIDPRINPDGVVASKKASMTEEEMLALQPGDIVFYDDGRPGHQGSKAKVIGFLRPRLLQVQFEDRAQPTTIAVNEWEWTGALTKVKKEPFADIDPDVMGPQRQALPRAKSKGRRQLISPNDRARKSSDKTAEYSQQDAERDEQAQYFLEQVEEAEDEAKRHFMQEDYIKQLAEENLKSMEDMWEMMGDEYAAEFYGYPYKRVPDFTDQEAPEPKEGVTGVPKIGSEIRIRFKDKEEVYPVAPQDVMKAVQHAENLSMANPGFPVVFIIDEEGVVTEDTYINGNHVGETVEKFAFRATR